MYEIENYIAFRHKTNLDFESNCNECGYDISFENEESIQYFF